MITLDKDHKMLGYASLNAYSNISHFVTTRHGGYSCGTYGTFNCAPFSGDAPESVRRNQQLLMNELDPRPLELVIPMQTHGTVCEVIDDRFLSASPEQRRQRLTGVDALMTDRPGQCLCISTADCVPVLVYDRTHRAIAAVHAGWRGTVAGIVTQTLQRMHQTYGTSGEDVVACIGPSISQAAFEVGEEVYEAFRQQRFDLAQIAVRHPDTGKAHLDLWRANAMQLEAFGVSADRIEVAGLCTYILHEQFFSARRLGIHSGRILSGIALNVD